MKSLNSIRKTSRNKRNKMSSSEQDILVVLIVIAIIIIFIVTLGRINPNNAVKFPDEFKDTKEEAKRRHKRLKELIEKKEALKNKLNKRFKTIYFLIRLALVILWFGIIGSLYIFNLINNISDILTYSEALLLLCVILNFLTFGSLTNMNEFIDSLKTKTENWIYDKYIVIDKTIETHKIELIKLEKVIQ